MPQDRQCDYKSRFVHCKWFYRRNGNQIGNTNSIENFWSLLERTIKGTYVAVAPEHLQAYVEEQSFRYNEREENDQDRFVRLISGKRLAYASLIGCETSH